MFEITVVLVELQQASRAQILNKATDYIQFMRRKNHSHQVGFFYVYLYIYYLFIISRFCNFYLTGLLKSFSRIVLMIIENKVL